MADDEKDDMWSNEECNRIALEDNFPTAVFDLNIQKNIINRFLNFYLGGRPPRGMSVYDIVYSTISIMPLSLTTEEFIWPKPHYKENGTLFFLSADEKLKADLKYIFGKRSIADDIERIVQKYLDTVEMEAVTVKMEAVTVQTKPDAISSTIQKDSVVIEKETITVQIEPVGILSTADDDPQIISGNVEDKNYKTDEETSARSSVPPNLDIPKFPVDITWYTRNRTKKAAQEVKYRSFGPAENAAFVTCCNKLLYKWNSSEKARIFLKYFFGMIALTLMRGTTKSYKHLVNTLASEKYISNLPITMLASFTYCMPHKWCVKSSHRAFWKRGVSTRIMFAKLVVNSDYVKKHNNVDIFALTVLAHTSLYGLGLLDLVDTVSRYGSLARVVEASYCTDTAESWRRIERFTWRYLSGGSGSNTVWWARLIDPNIFTSLSCTENYPLAIILAVFIENLSGNHNVWRSKWVSGPRNERENDLEKFKELGNEMYKQFTSLSQTFVFTKV